MAAIFPFTLSPSEETHVQFPPTNHSRLQQQDAKHSILATFLPQAMNRDPNRIQLRLIELYGGRAVDYPVLKCSNMTFIIRLPEYLQLRQNLDDLLIWGVQHAVSLEPWDLEEDWSASPQSFRVSLLITNYPIEFWHPLYFTYLASPMGSLLYIADQNAKGNDRSSLRLTIQCLDPLRIPKVVVLHHEGKWRRCKVLIKGWSFEGTPPPDSPGPWSRGQMQDSDSQISLDWQRDWVLRWAMADARTIINQFAHEGQHASAHQRSYRCRAQVFTPIAHQMAQQNQNSPPLTRTPVETGLEFKRCKNAKIILPLGFLPNLDQMRAKGKVRKCKTLKPTLLLTLFSPQQIQMKGTGLSLALFNTATANPERTGSETAGLEKPGNRTFGLSPLNPATLLKEKNKSPVPGPSRNLPSILGPPPKIYPLHKKLCSSKPKYASLTSQKPPFTKRDTRNMNSEDEALIRKFSGLQTGELQEDTVISIPLQATTARNWKLCIVAKVHTDRAVFDAQFERAMRRVWRVFPETAFKMIDRGFYLIECSTEGEFQRITNEGPWSYRQDLVLVAECPSPDHLNESGLKSTEVWVQYHNLPADSLTEVGLLLVTNKVGVAISDPLRAQFNGRQYTRIKMLLSLDAPLRDHVTVRHPGIGDVKVHLVYERLERACLFCGAIGHELGSCQDRLRLAKIRLKNMGPNRPELEDILKPTRGAWINNQVMFPQQEEARPGPKAQQPNDKNGGVAGFKRSLNEILKPWPSYVSTQGVKINEPLALNNPNGVLFGNEEEGEILASKRARAAKGSPPAPT